MYLSPNRFGPDKVEKVEVMKKYIKDHEIDILTMSTPDRRWSISIREKMIFQFKQVNKDIIMNIYDSGDNPYIENT